METLGDAKCTEAQMGEQTGLLSRITSLFGRKNRINNDETSLDFGGQALQHPPVETRASVFRPWARRDHALQNLSEGFVTLTQLMSGIKENLERQNARQDDLMRVLSQLPQMIEAIPETNRHQAEALKTIYQQLAQQNQAQTTLGEVLNRICDTSGEQKNLINSLNDQLDSLRQTDANISNNLASVGTAMQTLGQNSQSSVQVLERLQTNIGTRDEAMHQMMQKQDYRFNMVFYASIVLSIATLLSLAMVTYLALK